jgi:hypothetical protein
MDIISNVEIALTEMDITKHTPARKGLSGSVYVLKQTTTVLLLW